MIQTHIYYANKKEKNTKEDDGKKKRESVKKEHS